MRRAALAVALALPLGACDGAMGLGSNAGGAPSAAMRSAAFYGGDVIVTGPPGYCIDPESLRRSTDSGFALMAGCGHLSDAPSGVVPPAVITVSVLPRDARAQMPTADAIAAPWAHAGVAQRIDGDGIALIQVAKGGNSRLPEGDPRHWRGAMLIGGHLVGLAVYGKVKSGVAGAAGKALLTATAEAMLDDASRAPAQGARPPQADAAKGNPSSAARPRRGLKSIVTGLFRKPA